MSSTSRNERGMALAIAIFALVLVGALVGGALFAGTQEQRVAEASRRVQQSFGVAELGVYDVIRTWNSASYNSAGTYPTDSIAIPNPLVSGVSPRGSGSYSGYVYKLNDEVYPINIAAHDTSSGIAGAGKLA